MKTTVMAPVLAAAVMLMTAPAFAGQAEVTWQNPDKYSDIRSGNESRKSMQKKIDKAFGKEFDALAARLPEGYRLLVTVTDLDLAGEVDPIPSRMMDQIRVLKDIYYPRMTLDYRVLSGSGAVMLEGSAVKLSDMQFLSGPRTSRSNEPFYYERSMIRDWFNKDILPKLK